MLSMTASSLDVSAAPASGRSGAFSSRVARAVLFMALVASPLAYGAVQTWAWVSLTILADLIFVLWAIGCVRGGGLTLFWPPLCLPAALFLLWGGVQLSGHLTLDPIATREALLKLSTDFLLFFLAGQLLAAAGKRTWQVCALGATIYAFALAVFAILQFFSSQGLIYWSVKSDGWAFGPYVNHNHYAGLMEMLIPLSVAYVVSRPRHHPGRAMLVFAVSVMAASVLLSGSRGGMVSLLAEALMLGAILGARSALPSWRRVGIAAPLGLLTAALLFFWFDPGEMAGRLATVVKFTRPADIGMAERQAVALDSLRILRQRPWAGSGLGSFEVAYPEHQSFISNFVWDHAHNDYAEALVESGLVGGALIVWALVLFFRLSFQSLVERVRHETGKLQLGAALGCAGLLVHSTFDFNLHIPANAAWFVVCAAAGTTGTAAASLATRPSSRG